jgi:hypothetical protein
MHKLLIAFAMAVLAAVPAAATDTTDLMSVIRQWVDGFHKSILDRHDDPLEVGVGRIYSFGPRTSVRLRTCICDVRRSNVMDAAGPAASKPVASNAWSVATAVISPWMSCNSG